MFPALLAVALTTTLLQATPPTIPPTTPPPSAVDAAVSASVARAVSTYPRFTIFDDVTVEVDGRAVTLRGKVTMPFKRDEIGRRAAAAAAGYSVENHIDVLPVSIDDDALRKRVARAIYGNPAFWRQAAMANPPIHIVVERGRVTLTGVVPSEVDRALARSLATGHGELSLTSALRTDAEVRAGELARVQRAAAKTE